jgi:hypothetical protein
VGLRPDAGVLEVGNPAALVAGQAVDVDAGVLGASLARRETGGVHGVPAHTAPSSETRNVPLEAGERNDLQSSFRFV